MADVKINIPFRNALNGSDKSETYRIKSADVRTNEVLVEVQKEINGEVWKTNRKWTWHYTHASFKNNGYEYLT